MMRAWSLALVTLVLAGCGTTPLVRVGAEGAIRATSDAGLHAGVVKLRQQRFAALDLDHDGFVTPDEASTDALYLPGLISGFQDYDANHDLRISPQEFLREDVIHYWMELLRPKIREYFDRADTDRDGALQGAERRGLDLYFAPFPALHGGDLDQDGRISYDEYEDAYMVALPYYQPVPGGGGLK